MFQHTRAFWVALIALTFPFYAYAYKPALHEAFSEQSWSQAMQAKQFRKGSQRFSLEGLNVGAVFGPEFNRQDLSYQEPIDRSLLGSIALGNYVERQGGPRELIGWGAIWEDEATAAPWSQRPFNHFYDVQNDRGLTLELPLWRPPGSDPYTYFISSIIPPGSEVISYPGPTLGNRSPDWILHDRSSEIKHNFTFTNFEPNKYSWWSAQGHFANALQNSTKEQRKLRLEEMYKSLGHILHHIQDMGQPQHVRNDMHCDGCGPLNDESGLEAITGSNPATIRKLVSQAANSYDNAVMFSTPREYWTNSASSGMAQFTSHNFVSTESMFEPIDPSTGIQGNSLLTSLKPNSNYPLPTTRSLYLNEQSFTEAVKSSSLPINGEIVQRLKDAKIAFVGNKVTDPLTGITHFIDKFATVSAFGHDFKSNNALIPANTDVLTLNHLNYSDQIKVLFPRIIAFGEGFLRHFFRVQISAEGVGLKDNRYRVSFTNKTVGEPGTDRTLNGNFYIMAEYSNGNRQSIGNISATLAEGETRTMEGTLRSTADPVAIGVYFTGSQGQVVGGGYGKFTPYPDEEESYTPCVLPPQVGNNIYFSALVHQLGSRPGTVRLTYNFYSSQVELMVIHGNTVIASTDGFRTGSRTMSFYYNPAAHNNLANVTIWINSPEGHYWRYDLGCPTI